LPSAVRLPRKFFTVKPDALPNTHYNAHLVKSQRSLTPFDGKSAL
jgi:hypothetical protein